MFQRLVALMALAASSALAQPHYSYKFDPALSGGVKGHIKVQYAGSNSSVATITSDLDFSGVNTSLIAAADANCTTNVTAYKYHIHVKWSSSNSSNAYALCAKTLTGNHYDPLYACGANSEYSDSTTCQAKVASYSCTPTTYAANPLACEKGDLSGKLGVLTLDASKKVQGTWTDTHYPLPSENTAQWNMILHASCGSAPRVACAIADKDDATPAPTHPGCY